MESVKKFEMVPASMLLDKSVISAINFHCGDDDGDDGQFGKYSDGLLWIGTVTDDDGKEIHGLHLATAEYPEEGSTTLVEFDAPATDLAEVERLTAEREALQLLLNNRDDQLTTLEQRRYAEQQAREAAERDAERYRWLLGNADIMHWENMLRCADLEGVESINQFIDAAINHAAEAVSHE